MPFSFRLDARTAALIRRLAKTTGQSRASIVREAVVRYGEDAGAPAKTAESALDLLRPYLGFVSTGGAQFSTDTHAKFAASLEQKRRARRSR
jgi:predicted DNA-binding protein